MRNNRIWIVPILLVLAFSLSGCMDIQDLTEEEGNMLAEYSAGILLRYSDQYERRLITKEQREEDKTAATSTPEETTAPATPEPSLTPGDTGNDETTPQDTANTVTLNDLYHMKGLDFSYRSYQFCNQYPENSDGTSPATAEQDETLLVVSFEIKNKSGKRKKVSLGSRDITYTLTTADGSEYQPVIAILKNTGLNFLNTTIEKDGKEEAVLIYRMAKEQRDASSISLRIQEGNNAVDIPLK